MNTVLPLLAVLILQAAPVKTEETPTTRLFVRTVPKGATIILDGKPLGTSDGLFLVPPGVHKITVEFDGYYPEVEKVDVPAQWITRVEFVLKQQSEPPKQPPNDQGKSRPDEKPPDGEPAPRADANSDAGSKRAGAYLARADVPEPVRSAMLTVLRQHPTQTRWSGRSGAMLFAVAAKSLPGGQIRQRAVPALLELTHMLAVHEVLKAKSLLDRYAATGLTDATTLREAVDEAAGQLRVSGEVKGVIHQTAVEGDFAVGYVIAEESALTAYLLQPVELEKVQVAYRDVMHRQARELMERSNWEDALLLWQHLHERKLVSQKLYLDAAGCFRQLGQDEDAVRVLTEAIDAFGQEGSPEFFEQAGDMALAIETEPAEALAEKAYRIASERLFETISQAQPQGGDENQPK